MSIAAAVAAENGGGRGDDVADSAHVRHLQVVVDGSEGVGVAHLAVVGVAAVEAVGVVSEMSLTSHSLQTQHRIVNITSPPMLSLLFLSPSLSLSLLLLSLSPLSSLSPSISSSLTLSSPLSLPLHNHHTNLTLSPRSWWHVAVLLHKKTKDGAGRGGQWGARGKGRAPDWPHEGTPRMSVCRTSFW